MAVAGTPTEPVAPPPALAQPGVAWRWVLLAALLVGAVAGVLRFAALSEPHALVFDETYYAKDAWAMLTTGTAREWEDDSDERILDGDLSGMTDNGAFVSHPPAGKWLIALGESRVGMTPLGWRTAGAFGGALAAAGMVLVGALLFRSVGWATVAGGLVAVDGLAVVMSRTALLDGFVMLWLVVALAALLADRRQMCGRERVRRWRPWRLTAGVALGLATATKWSGLPLLAALGLLSVGWQYRALRQAGVERPRATRSTLFLDGPWALLTMVGSALLTYLITWTGWLRSTDGWGRTWGAENPTDGLAAVVPDALRSLWHYHAQIYELVGGLEADHDWASSPGGWLLQLRPVLFHSETIGPTHPDCESGRCVIQVLSLGTPAIWWAGTAAAAVCVVLWLLRRDWRAGLAVVGVAATWLPWFLFTERPLFAMYLVVTLPFLVIGLVHVLRLLTRRRRVRWLWWTVVVGFLVLVAWQTWYFWPIWSATALPLEEWRERMWLPGWS